MPAFNITSDFLNKSYLYFIFFDLLIVPTFVALSKLLNIDFKSLRVLERDRKFSRIMFFTNFILISYVIFNYAVVVASQFFSLYYAGPIVTLVGFASILLLYIVSISMQMSTLKISVGKKIVVTWMI